MRLALGAALGERATNERRHGEAFICATRTKLQQRRGQAVGAGSWWMTQCASADDLYLGFMGRVGFWRWRGRRGWGRLVGARLGTRVAGERSIMAPGRRAAGQHQNKSRPARCARRGRWVGRIAGVPDLAMARLDL
jgi:hypothetical protein